MSNIICFVTSRTAQRQVTLIDADDRVKQIQSGQQDGKRKQLQMEPEELAIFGSFKRALEEAGEANGRKLSECNVIQAVPT